MKTLCKVGCCLVAAVAAVHLATAVETITKFGYVPEASYIDTGVKPTQNTRVEMRVWVAGVQEYWFGVWDTDWNRQAFCYGNDARGLFTAYGNEGGTEAFGDAITIKPGEHALALTNGVFYCDGHVVKARSQATFSLSHSLYLFGQNRIGQLMAVGDIWCDSARIYEGDTLVRDYRAVYEGDNVRFVETLSGETALGPYENRQIVPLQYLDVPSGAYASTLAFGGAPGSETGGSAVYGSAYVGDAQRDIGYPSDDLTVETRAPVLGSGKFQEWFGLYDDMTQNRFVFANNNGADTCYVGWGTYSRSVSPAIPEGEWILHLGPDFAGYISPDGAQTNKVATDYSDSSFSPAIANWLYFCAQNRTRYATEFPSETMCGWKWFKVWKSGVLKRYYVPARLGTSLVGFYDTVRGGLQASCGKVAFVAGPDGSVEDALKDLGISGQTCAPTETSLVVTVRGRPVGASVRVTLAANGRIEVLDDAVFSSESNAVFTATGLAPGTKYVVTALASTNGFATAATNVATFATAREGNTGSALDGYEVIPAVRFNGTQYLSTGIVPSDHRIMVDYQPLSFADDAHIVGTECANNWLYVNWTEYRNSSQEPVYYIGHHGDVGYGWGCWGSGRHVLVLNDREDGVYTHRFDDREVESGSDKLASSTSPLMLNFRGTSGERSRSANMTFDGYVYAFTMTDNETGQLVADYVPARDPSTGAVGFYDRVSKTLKTATYGIFSADVEAGAKFDVRSVSLDGASLALDLACAGATGTLRCYYGEQYGSGDATTWAGSIELGEVASVATSVVRTVAMPVSSGYVRFGVETANSVVWGPAYALAWLPPRFDAVTIPDTRELLASYVARFNKNDGETVKNAFPNDRAYAFLSDNAPRFACPDKDIERTYYFRWWTYRKHIRNDLGVWTVSEYLPDVSWAGAGNTIVCPAGHHVREGRWLRDPQYLESDLKFWLSDARSTHRHDYVSWLFTAACRFADVTGDGSLPSVLLDDAAAYYDKWAAGFTVGGDRQGGDGAGGFVSTDNREGSEHSLSGGGYRPLVNAAMRSEAECICRVARKAGRRDLVRRYSGKGEATAEAMRAQCWNAELGFYTAGTAGGAKGAIRELHGYAPWYFGLGTGDCAADWSQLDDPNGFAALYGLSFPERRAPGFTIAYSGHDCQWNGPSWPFATSIALTALADELHRGGAAAKYADTFRRALRQYARQHRLSYDPHAVEEDIVPWIDENFDEDAFDWVARAILNKSGPSVRGKDYNHSTFCDLVISGLVGIVPNGVGALVVDPLVPSDWPYFALEDVRYHGHDVSVRFERGTTGYRVLLDGRTAFASDEPARCTVTFPEQDNVRIRTLVDDGVSLSLVGRRLTLRVAAGAVSENALACIAWGKRDCGADIQDWPQHLVLDGLVGPEGVTNVYDAAELGIPDGATCRVFLTKTGITSVSYVSARDGQSVDLGISERDACAFELGFALNAASGANRWDSVFTGTLDDFTLGTIATKHRQIYLRHRTDEAWANSPVTDILHPDQMTDMSVCNDAALTNGVFTVNGVRLCTADTTLSLGTGTANLRLFDATSGGFRRCDARCFYLRLYDAQGKLLRDWKPALDPNGVPCLYERLEGRYYYVGSGQAALAYDASTVHFEFGEEISRSGVFRFYTDSTKVPGGGFAIIVR